MEKAAVGQFEGGAAFVDGEVVPLSEAKISMFDWGFTRSDVTYDVGSVWQGAFFRLDAHIERFFNSLDTLRMKIPYDRAQVRDILHNCVRAGNLQDAYVAMVCTRGVPPRGARDPRLAQNRFYAYALPYVWIASRDKQREGIDLHISGRVRIGAASVDPTVKNYHWLDLVQSMFDAYDRGADTSCVVDADGNITEGPGFNVFVVKDGVVHTTDRGVLEGISRRTAIELCERLGITVQLAPFHADAMRAADEVFLTSTGGGILPIAKLDGVPLPSFPGPVTTRLHDAYWAIHDEDTYRDPVDYR
ncbi:aminotransferase class IV [Paraburkholderia sp.]|uniref:aminotransferase class IV n=1 Tax=Paraburkholderia sp. TaxID=1926495 RepID=UPI002386D468|nr:aminotransferase class IV [Paraburkholderia sp.]MDE1179304.1 aminotransferase class IV [Paraburkholderia sp.]